MTESKRILDMVKSPADVKCLTDEELAILCRELREEMVEVTSRTGGHLASSLGAVEIIVALHSLLNCPDDKLVFDVGHQAYAHKLLTGRRDAFPTLRQIDGLTGFPNPAESPYDAHPSGHASDSLSVAMGLAKARDIAGGANKVVAVIGDASLAGGMAFEALNHIGQDQTRMVIVLNDNGMSISKPVGALVRHLGYLRTRSEYRQTRDALQQAMEAGGVLSRGLVDLGRNMKESMKQFVIPHAMIFEQLGITCTAPVDGHDVAALRQMFRIALESDGPVLVHVITQKGHGYGPSEANPETFHGVSPFDIATGQVKKKAPSAPTYTSVFGDALVREARADKKIVAITAAMKDGAGLDAFSKEFPSRFIDTGITEEHAVALASGLAAGGMKPVVAVYSTFLQRAFDQIVIDNALAERDTVFAIDRAGIVGDDGATHTGAFDIVYMRTIPHMRVLTPSNEAELASALHTALALPGPVALRYPRGAAVGVPVPAEPECWEEGRAHTVREGDDIALLGFGNMVNTALDVADSLSEAGISARVVDMRWAKPIDTDAVAQSASCKLVVTLEEGALDGGAGEGVLDVLSSLGAAVPTLLIGLPDEFVMQGKPDQVRARLGLDARGVLARIEEKLASL